MSLKVVLGGRGALRIGSALWEPAGGLRSFDLLARQACFAELRI
jgi:hypothetical protein